MTQAAAALPDDVLAAILACLPARSLAASRCVCSAWRDLVDERQLLARHLLPHSVSGLFINDDDQRHPRFFARPMPPSGEPVDGKFGFIEDGYQHKRGTVLDHCNGLVLYTNSNSTAAIYVCNPATRQWARLPSCPSRDWTAGRRAFLAFDPVTSLQYYEVLLAPHLPSEFSKRRSMKWPPSQWTWPVFSSIDGQWGERAFVREGEAAGTVAAMRANTKYVHEASTLWLSATYWEGALYLNFFREYILKMCLSNNKFRVIKSPVCQDDSYIGATTYLGKSEKGMYFATIHHDYCQLRVWMLHELCEGTECATIHHDYLKPAVWWMLAATKLKRDAGPWNLDQYDNAGKKGKARGLVNHDSEWDSEDDNVVDFASRSDEESQLLRNANDVPRDVAYSLLGFHPYREVVYLCAAHVAVAYHLKDSKVQHLGTIRLHDWHYSVDEAFMYTPCMIGDL
ncbi:hypothetical protein EJB05_27007, partial [Eragrostis curvula]